MDLTTFLTALVVIMVLVIYKQWWMILLLLLLIIATTKSITDIVAIGLGVFVLYLIQSGSANEMWPVIVIALIIIALLLGIKPEAEGAGYAPGLDYSSLFGGGGSI
ncbi:MAG: hypothetical protein DRO04_01040 [Candidatus Iainarchaeum archaeon]|uniref:Uncharacterized protein n=1 Tax=Candidatus Iainarchaeum sp. TaxID=3101447 RepID=A0A497JIS2_9ARCH|nr:MAG: hypothetical protein DRO04_01040 [Candidatus Diapherotrites archaeon]